MAAARTLARSAAAWLERCLAGRGPALQRVCLDRRRVYILPSRVGGAYLLALLLMLVAAINYQNSLAYGLTFLLGSLFFVAILHTWRNLAGLVLQAAGTAPVHAGESARARVRLQAGARGHRAIRLGLAGSPLQTVDVARGEVAELSLDVLTRQRGWLQVGRLRVESRYPLGLLVAWSWVRLDLAILVYPAPAEPLLHERLPTGGSGEPGRDPVRPGTDDYRGPRDWQRGDSLRRLDWRAYSRGRGLLVKDFAEADGSEPLLDFSALGGDTEHRLSVLCQRVLALSQEERTFALQLPDQRLGPACGPLHRDRCLRALALFGLEETPA